MNNEPAPENEAELEAFRRRWREEVQSRNQHPQGPSSEKAKPQQRRKSTVQPSKPAVPAPSSSKKADEVDYDHIGPKAYHDLPDKEAALKLGVEGQGQEQEGAKLPQEPSSALEHYEKAVEKETHGQLGDSLNHYRKAFKLDDGVHEHYKKKHFPPSSFAKPKAPPTNTTKASSSSTTEPAPAPPSIPASLTQLVSSFSTLCIEPEPPETDFSPPKPCHLAEIPEEILSHILLDLAVADVAAFARMAQVCKRLAYLVMTEESVWKRVTLGDEHGFAAMHYDYATTIEGRPLVGGDDEADLSRYLGSSEEDDPEAFPPNNSLAARSLSHTLSLLPTPYPNYRSMFRSRPRLRFNGCYISTVNYARPGAHASNSLAWGAPVLVVTYFRYLRFFRDGTAISLLSTTEPADVVHHLTKANLDAKTRDTTGGGTVMKEALRGRWRLSGPLSSKSKNNRLEDNETPDPTNPSIEQSSALTTEPEEEEGTVHIETQGVVPRYTYKLALKLGHAGKLARNNKLAWKGFWSYNRLSDDWGEFALRNDKAFYWSRVRSYDGWE